MDEARIDMSAVFAAAIDDVRTKEVLKSIKPYRDRLFAVGAVSPFNPRFQPSLEKVDDWLGEGKIPPPSRSFWVPAGLDHHETIIIIHHYHRSRQMF